MPATASMTAIRKAIQIGKYNVCLMGPFEKLALTKGELEYRSQTYHYGRGQKHQEFFWRDEQESLATCHKMMKANVWEC